MFYKNVHPWIHGVLLAIGSVLLFVNGPDYYSSRSFKHFWDIGHVVYFALFAGLLSRSRFIAEMSLRGKWTVILATTVFVGLSIEFMQYGTSRTPDTGDVLRDLTGSLLVLVYGSLGTALRPATWRLFLQFTVLTLSLVQVWPLARSLIDEAIARRQFPLLSNLETPFEIYRWARAARLSVESIPSLSPRKLLKLPLTTDRYSGAALKYFDGNWTSFRTLRISIYNPDVTPLLITCRIHDLQHVDGYEEYQDRFNRKFLLVHEWNHVEIDLDEVKRSPAHRSMDMSKIRGIGLFAVSLPEPRVLYLDSVRLFP